MDKDTVIELLKIVAMIVVLVALIFGIVWINREDVPENDTTETIETENTEDLDLPPEDNTEAENTESTENNTENNVTE